MLAQGESALAAVSTLLGQKFAVLDCSGVEALSQGERATLFSEILAAWQFVGLGKVIEASSLSESLSTQINSWVTGDFAGSEKLSSAKRQEIGTGQSEPNVILKGRSFPEPVKVLVTQPVGNAIKIIGEELTTNQLCTPILTQDC